MKLARRFDSDEYVNAFALTGAFPRIHRHVAQLVREEADEAEPAMDLGAAVGLLGAQLLAIRRSKIICVEPSRERVAKAVDSAGLLWLNRGVSSPADVDAIASAAREYGVTLVTARRVLYEIEDDRAGLVVELGLALRAAGVRKMVVEGCVPVRNPRVTLFETARECAALADSFTVRRRLAGAAYLEAR